MTIDQEAVERTARLKSLKQEIDKIEKYPEPTRTQLQRLAEARDEARTIEIEAVRESLDAGWTDRGTTPGWVKEDAKLRSVRSVFRGDPWEESAVRGGERQDLTARAKTAIERCDRMPDSVRELGTQLLQRDDDRLSRLARYTIELSNPEYFRAFSKILNDPVSGQYEWTPAERDAHIRVKELERGMVLGTGSAGGFLVPYELDPAILISNTGYVDPMREVARVEQTVLNEKRFVTSAGVTASWDAEAAEVSDDTPTLAQPSITAFKGAAFVPVSFELFEDSDISQQVGALFADAKANLEATAFTTGSGSGQPKGVITAVAAVGGSVVTEAAGSAMTTASAYNNQNALPARWRPRAKFMANLVIINQLRQLIKGTGLAESLVDDSTTPPKMLGWQFFENNAMDSTFAAGNDYVLLSGDFSQYIIVDRLGATVEVMPHLVGANRRPTGERGFYLHWRAGGDAVITDAFRLTNFSA